MAASGKTSNYSLPIYNAEDITSWTIDFNGAMEKIDEQMKINADNAQDNTAVQELTEQLNAAVARITNLEKAILKVGDIVEFRANNKIATITKATSV